METCKLKNKVLAYITRPTPAGVELLIFAHRDYPEAGLQVPGGTLDEGEDPVEGVLREVKEEAGLDAFSEVILLGETEYVATEKKEIHLRSFFHLTFVGDSDTTFPYTVSVGEEDKGLMFLYEWVGLAKVPVLAAEQGELLTELIKD